MISACLMSGILPNWPLAYYSEIIPSAFSFENRTEFHINFDIPFGGGGSGGEPDDGKEAKAAVPQSSPAFVLGNKINFGIDFHYQEVTAFDDYFDEPLNAWNLATSRNFIHYANFSTFTALPIPNNPGWTGTPGVYNNDTNYSKVFTVAPFYEHVFDFGEHFSLLAGVRADVVRRSNCRGNGKPKWTGGG
jgi:hypothetical protein